MEYPSTPQEHEFFLLHSLCTMPVHEHAFYTFFTGVMRGHSTVLYSSRFIETARRHELIRSEWIDKNGEIVRRVTPIEHWVPDFEVKKVIMSEKLHWPNVPSELTEIVQRVCHAPFGELKWPVRIRVFDFELADGSDAHALVVIAHHIVADLFGIAQIVNELGTGKILCDIEHNVDVQGDVGYWNRLLDGVEFTPPTSDLSGTSACFSLPKECLKAVKAHRASRFSVLLTLFLMWLYCRSREKVICGCATTLRDLRSVDSLATIGSLSNVIPVIFDGIVDSFESAIQVVREQLGQSLEHRWAPPMMSRPQCMFGLQRVFGMDDSAPHFLMKGGYRTIFNNTECLSMDIMEKSVPFDTALLVCEGDGELIGRLQSRDVGGVDAMADSLGRFMHEFLIDRSTSSTSSITEIVRGLSCSDQTAVEYEDRRLTYSQLHAFASTINHDGHVGICVKHDIDIASFIAVWIRGSCVVPLDPYAPKSRRDLVVGSVDLDLILVSRDLAHLVDDHGVPIQIIDWNTPNLCLPIMGQHNDIAYVLLTSGTSSGTGNVVSVTHDAVVNVVRYFVENGYQSEGFRGGLWTHLTFDVGMLELLSPILYGGTVVVCPEATRSSVLKYTEFIRGKRLNVCWMPPYYIPHLAKHTPSMPHLQCLLTGIEPVATAHLHHIYRSYPGLQVLNGYGPTETTIFSMCWDASSQSTSARAPIGYAISGTVIILSPEFDGEILIGGIGVSPSSKTIEIHGTQYYRTGDRAVRQCDGSLVFMGRYDRQIKLKGVRIEPSEIESTLLNVDSIVNAVVSVQHGKLCAIVAVDTVMTSGDVSKYLAEHLPAYCVPTTIKVVSRIPTLSNGKIDWSYDEPCEYITVPFDTVIGIVRQAFGIEIDHDDTPYMELGINSIHLVSIYHTLTPHYPYLRLVDLFHYPTATSLSHYISEGDTAIARPIVPVTRIGSELAIVGYDCVTPAGFGTESLYEAVMSGKDCLTRIHCADRVWSFGPLESEILTKCSVDGISEAELLIMDPQQRLWLLMCQRVCAVHDGNTGVFCGVGSSTYWRAIDHPELLNSTPANANRMNSSMPDTVPTRTSYVMNLHGPSVGILTACSSALTAVHIACQSLRLGECDSALAGGVSVLLPQCPVPGGYPGSIYSIDGYVRPFCPSRSGTVVSNGGGVVLLKRLEDIGDDIHAHGVVIGSAVVNDGKKRAGFAAPSVDGQVECILRANPGNLIPDLWETHGTGTKIGDDIERKSASIVLGAYRPTLSCVKSVLGHLNTAAGIVGLINLVMCIERGVKPRLPLACIECDSSGPFALPPDHATNWKSRERIGCVSSFGIGGTNAHALIQNGDDACPPQVPSRLGPTNIWHDDAASPNLIIPPTIGHLMYVEENTLTSKRYSLELDGSVINTIRYGHSSIVPLTLYLDCLLKCVGSPLSLVDFHVNQAVVVLDTMWFVCVISDSHVSMGFVEEFGRRMTSSTATAVVSDFSHAKFEVSVAKQMEIGDFYTRYNYSEEFKLLDCMFMEDHKFRSVVSIKRDIPMYIQLDSVFQAAAIATESSVPNHIGKIYCDADLDSNVYGVVGDNGVVNSMSCGSLYVEYLQFTQFVSPVKYADTVDTIHTLLDVIGQFIKTSIPDDAKLGDIISDSLLLFALRDRLVNEFGKSPQQHELMEHTIASLKQWYADEAVVESNLGVVLNPISNDGKVVVWIAPFSNTGHIYNDIRQYFPDGFIVLHNPALYHEARESMSELVDSYREYVLGFTNRREVVVVGTSMSCLIALKLAIAIDHASLVLLDPVSVPMYPDSLLDNESTVKKIYLLYAAFKSQMQSASPITAQELFDRLPESVSSRNGIEYLTCFGADSFTEEALERRLRTAVNDNLLTTNYTKKKFSRN